MHGTSTTATKNRASSKSCKYFLRRALARSTEMMVSLIWGMGKYHTRNPALLFGNCLQDYC
jgi:hypothetical protein